MTFKRKEAKNQKPSAALPLNRIKNHYLKNKSLKKVLYSLYFLRSFEVVAEMLALKKWGQKSQRNVVLFIEIIKAALRFAFVKSTKKMILSTQLPERDYDPALLKPHDSTEPGSWIAKRSGIEHHSVSALLKDGEATEGEGAAKFEKSLEYLMSKAMIEPAQKPTDLLTTLQGPTLYAEYLYILRPLIYCFLS